MYMALLHFCFFVLNPYSLSVHDPVFMYLMLTIPVYLYGYLLSIYSTPHRILNQEAIYIEKVSITTNLFYYCIFFMH